MTGSPASLGDVVRERMRVLTLTKEERRRLDERIGRFWLAARGGAAQARSAFSAGRVSLMPPSMDGVEFALRELHVNLEHCWDDDGALRVVARDPSLRALVERVAALAPANLPFPVAAGAGRLDLDHALELARETTGVDLTGARVRVGFSRGHLLEIVVSSRRIGSAEDVAALEAAELLVAALLGEHLAEDWIGGVSVGPLVGGGPLRVVEGTAARTARELPLAELVPAVDAAIAGLLSGLPLAPPWEAADGAEWTLLEVEVAEDSGPEWPGTDDLLLAATPLPEMLKCFLQGAPFASRRFTRGSERFCYLKLDGRGSTVEERVATRDRVEAAVDELLRSAGAGGVVGHGVGVRYTYVMLALRELEHAPEQLMAWLREQATITGWLMFCDSVLEQEWLGTRSRQPPGY